MKIGIYTSSFENFVEADVSAGILADTLSHKHEIELVRTAVSTSPEHLRLLCDSPLEQVTFRTISDPPQRVTDPGSPERRYQALRDWSDELTRPYDLFVNFSDRVPIYCSASRGVLVVQFPYDFIPSLYRASWLDHLASYQVKISNSHYTRFWTRIFWELDCSVVYPPVPIQTSKTVKENLIVAIAPFGTARSGKQLELITAFEQLKNRLPAWSFSIMGEVEAKPSSKTYFETVCDSAANSSVTVLANPSIEQQRDLINRARLLWMGAGLGEDLDFQPEKAIPFSLSLVQSMSAGCVPLVTNSGGLSEILRHGENGYFWDSTSQLIECSSKLGGNEPRRLELALAARRRARDFRPERFTASFLKQLRTAFGPAFGGRRVGLWKRVVTSAANSIKRVSTTAR